MDGLAVLQKYYLNVVPLRTYLCKLTGYNEDASATLGTLGCLKDGTINVLDTCLVGTTEAQYPPIRRFPDAGMLDMDVVSELATAHTLG